MRTEFWFDSCGAGKIHGCKWVPEGQPKAVVQILHGISDHILRYETFADYLTKQGYLVIGEDHMGHGLSVNGEGIEGYFHGGWFCAVEDSYRLLRDTRKAYPDLPFVLLGHSMGSFMARTILCQHPDSGIDGVILSGTCWQPQGMMPAVVKMMELAGKAVGEKNPSEKLQNLIFGSYNARVDHRRTPVDWVSRDNRIVDAHPMMHGFRPKAGLLRDMMIGLNYSERPENLANMRKDLPVYFVAGGADPVGNYGKGIHQAADVFRKTGMTDISVKIFPLCRHEILNEINKEEIFSDLVSWMDSRVLK